MRDFKDSLESFFDEPGIQQIPELINWTSELISKMQRLFQINQSVYVYTHKMITAPENFNEKEYLETNKDQFTRPLKEINTVVQEMQNFISTKYDVYPWFERELKENNSKEK